MPKLTVAFVESLGTPERDTLIMDDGQKGFGLRLTPAGARLFLVKKRHDGKIVKKTFGQMANDAVRPTATLPTLTIKEARSRAAVMLGAVANGQSLSETLKEAEAPPAIETFSDVADRWLDQHVRPKLKPYTVRDYEVIVRTLRARFGEKAFDGITRDDVRKLHAEMRGTPRRANYYLQVISAIYNFAEAPKNPAAKIAKYREGKRERIMSSDELSRVAAAISQAEGKGLSVWACEAIRFAIATGARPSEIQAIEWKHLDHERKRVVLPDSKANRPRILYTNSVAWTILMRTPRFGKYVFAGKAIDTSYARLTNAWSIVRASAGLDDVRLYDARHTFASEAAKAGHNLPMIGALLGHSVPATTQRYVHLVDDPVARAAQDVGDAMSAASDKLAAQQAAATNVTPLPKLRKALQ